MRFVYDDCLEHAGIIASAHGLNASDRYRPYVVLGCLYLPRHFPEHSAVLIPCLFDQFVPVREDKCLRRSLVRDRVKYDRLSASGGKNQKFPLPVLPMLVDRFDRFDLIRSQIKCRTGCQGHTTPSTRHRSRSLPEPSTGDRTRPRCCIRSRPCFPSS